MFLKYSYLFFTNVIEELGIISTEQLMVCNSAGTFDK